MAKSTPEMNNLEMSEGNKPLLNAVIRHIRDNVDPITEEYFRLGEGRADRWSHAPGQLELLEGAKQKARDAGLWNFFLPNAETGEGLSNLDYAYIAAELGKSPLAPETLNCSAPDTGNMEVLERVGTQEQKDKWLKPLLAGEIRSAFAMTEPMSRLRMPRTSRPRRCWKTANGSSTARNIISRVRAIRAARS